MLKNVQNHVNAFNYVFIGERKMRANFIMFKTTLWWQNSVTIFPIIGSASATEVTNFKKKKVTCLMIKNDMNTWFLFVCFYRNKLEIRRYAKM